MASLAQTTPRRLTPSATLQDPDDGDPPAGGHSASAPRCTFVTQYLPPETFAGANRVGALVSALSRSYPTRVVTLKPSYPSRAAYRGIAVGEADAALGLPVERLFHFEPHRSSPVRRALGEQAMATALAVAAARHPAEVVLTSVPGMLLAPSALVLARAKRALFVCDVRDLTWDFAREVVDGSRTQRAGLDALSRVLWSTVRSAGLVTAATAGLAERLERGGVDRRRLVLVPNSVSSPLLRALEPCGESVPKARPVVLYAGLLGDAQGLEVALEMAGRLPGVDVRLAGDGPCRAALEEQARAAGLGNVHFPGYLTRAELIDEYRRADVLFAQIRDSPTLSQTAMPSKLEEYMATGKPTVYAGRGAAATRIEELGAGVSVAPGDAHAISQAVAGLLADPERARRLGRRGRAHMEGARRRDEHAAELVRAIRTGLGRR